MPILSWFEALFFVSATSVLGLLLMARVGLLRSGRHLRRSAATDAGLEPGGNPWESESAWIPAAAGCMRRTGGSSWQQ